MVNFLGDIDQDKRTLNGAVSISNPFNFQESCKHLKGTITDRFLTHVLKGAIFKHIDELESVNSTLKIDYKNLKKTNNLYSFDDTLTCKIFNLKSAGEYY